MPLGSCWSQNWRRCIHWSWHHFGCWRTRCWWMSYSYLQFPKWSFADLEADFSPSSNYSDKCTHSRKRDSGTPGTRSCFPPSQSLPTHQSSISKRLSTELAWALRLEPNFSWACWSLESPRLSSETTNYSPWESFPSFSLLYLSNRSFYKQRGDWIYQYRPSTTELSNFESNPSSLCCLNSTLCQNYNFIT